MNEAYFKDIEDVILRKMAGCSHVLVASAWLTSKRIIARLCEMDARVVISDKYEPHRSLKTVPIRIVHSDGTNMMHHKFMVLGDENGWREVITGSYNFTENAKTSNENIIASKDAGMVAEFVREFEGLFPPPFVAPLSLNHIVITRQLPWDHIWADGRDLTKTWDQHPIVSQLIQMLFHYFGPFDIRDETKQEWGARAIGGGVCILNERCKKGSREILVVKDDNNGTTYTISNYAPPAHGHGEELELDKLGVMKIIDVDVTKDDTGRVGFVWTACGRGTANASEDLRSWPDDGDYAISVYNGAGLWSEGMDVVTYLGSGYIMSITELWADEYFWRLRRREYLNQDGQIDEEKYTPEWVTFGWSLPKTLPCKDFSSGWRCEFHCNIQGLWDDKIIYGKGCTLAWSDEERQMHEAVDCDDRMEVPF